MATYAELSRFTYAELTQMNLTNEDLATLSLNDLLHLAKKLYSQVDSLPESKKQEHKKVLALIDTIFKVVLTDAICDLIDCKELLIQVLDLLKEICC